MLDAFYSHPAIGSTQAESRPKQTIPLALSWLWLAIVVAAYLRHPERFTRTPPIPEGSEAAGYALGSEIGCILMVAIPLLYGLSRRSGPSGGCLVVASVGLICWRLALL